MKIKNLWNFWQIEYFNKLDRCYERPEQRPDVRSYREDHWGQSDFNRGYKKVIYDSKRP